MKLDIEALAREADCLHVNLTGDRAKAIERLEAFARLTIEQCAVECDKVYYRNIGPAHGEVRHGIASCSAAIRQLLENK